MSKCRIFLQIGKPNQKTVYVWSHCSKTRTETSEWETLNLATVHRDSWRVHYYLFHTTPPWVKQHTICISWRMFLVCICYPQHSQSLYIYPVTPTTLNWAKCFDLTHVCDTCSCSSTHSLTNCLSPSLTSAGSPPLSKQGHTNAGA